VQLLLAKRVALLLHWQRSLAETGSVPVLSSFWSLGSARIWLILSS